MTEHTTRMNLPYPDGTDGPDGSGQIAALALAIDALPLSDLLGNYVSVQSGVNFDTGQGICRMLTFGALRIMSFAMYKSAGFTTATPILTVNAGHRPSGSVYSGGVVYDNSGSGPVFAAAGYQLLPNGELHVAGWTPDSGGDGLFQGARGQIIYLATQ